MWWGSSIAGEGVPNPVVRSGEKEDKVKDAVKSIRCQWVTPVGPKGLAGWTDSKNHRSKGPRWLKLLIKIKKSQGPQRSQAKNQ